MGPPSMQGGSINCLGKMPPKRSIFPEYWRQTNRIRLDLCKRPASPLTLSTHSRETADRTMVVDTGPSGSIPKKITLPIAITTPPRNGSIQPKSSLDSPPPFTIPEVPRRCILPQRRIYTTSSIPSELEQAKSLSPLGMPPSSGRLEYRSCSSPSRSCIRESRFSGWATRARSSSVESEGSTVRFDMKKLDVVHFDKPQETYADRGWADQFTV